MVAMDYHRALNYSYSQGFQLWLLWIIAGLPIMIAMDYQRAVNNSYYGLSNRTLNYSCDGLSQDSQL